MIGQAAWGGGCW